MEENSNYSIEHIDDKEKLFYHVAVGNFLPDYDFDNLPPHVFTPIGENLSVNWEKYCSTAQLCLDIKTEKYPNGRTKRSHGVGHFIAREVRQIDILQVIHDPTPNNKAHSSICGIPNRKPKPPFNEMRIKLKRIFHYWDIKPNLDSQEEEL
jgi:hypothetical protein